jgi:hypothetical protein
MPQAPDYLREKFEDDCAAWDVLDKGGFKEKNFVIYHPEGCKPTQEEIDAIDYLIMEWDWDYTKNAFVL